jgi:hypothetical protein
MINVGGAVIPTLMAVYLLIKRELAAPASPTAAARRNGDIAFLSIPFFVGRLVSYTSGSEQHQQLAIGSTWMWIGLGRRSISLPTVLPLSCF